MSTPRSTIDRMITARSQITKYCRRQYPVRNDAKTVSRPQSIPNTVADSRVSLSYETGLIPGDGMDGLSVGRASIVGVGVDTSQMGVRVRAVVVGNQ